MKIRIFPVLLVACLAPMSAMASIDGVSVSANPVNVGHNLVAKGNVSAGKRIALVIGNGNYQHQDSLPKLSNPTHDAEDIARALRGFGFEVIEKKDLSLEGINDAITEFGRKIVDSDAVLFYFAEHGLQVKGQNYLVPVNAKIDSEAQVPFQSLNVNQLLEEMENGRIPYQLSGGKLAVTVNGETTMFTRKHVAVGNNNTGSGNHRPGGISSELLLSSAWCTSSYNAKTGSSSSSKVQLRTDGTYSTGGQYEGYSSGYAGTYASQNNSTGGGRWKVVDGELYMAKGNDNLERVQTRIEHNNSGAVFIVADGVEYHQCR